MNKNGGRYWSDAETQALLRAFRHRSAHQTLHDFAVEYARKNGRGQLAVQGRLYSLGLSAGAVIPESKHKSWTDQPIIEGDALILSDMHIPYHDASFISKCISTAQALGIEKCVLGGDVVEEASYSHWAADFPGSDGTMSQSVRDELEQVYIHMDEGEQKDALLDLLDRADAVEGDAGEEIKETQAVLREIAKSFSEVVWIMGNHESRFIRLLERALPSETLAGLFGADPSWKVSPYYWCELKSNGETYRITHPKNSAKGSSKKIAPKHHCHIVMAHNHHFSMQTDPSGKYLAIEPGACVDIEKLPYEMQRDDAADKHMQGALIVQDGLPILLNKWTDWKTILRKD